MMWIRRLTESVSMIIVLVFSFEGFFISFSYQSNEWIRNQVDVLTLRLFEDPTLRALTLVVSILFLTMFLSAVVSLAKFGRREKTVSLKSPYGEVAVSLGAIEDFIKVIKDRVSGVKELRPKVFARTDGLKIYVRGVFWSDHKIHEVAQDVQETIRRYIQDTLGIEDVVGIRVLVVKILFREGPDGLPVNPRGIQYQELHD